MFIYPTTEQKKNAACSLPFRAQLAVADWPGISLLLKIHLQILLRMTWVLHTLANSKLYTVPSVLLELNVYSDRQI